MAIKKLEETVKSLFDKTANCDPDIIRTLDHAEHNIELDYRGRYILELLQNARDVAMIGQTLAKVKIIIQSNRLLIANNGADFNEDGLRSICRIGLSSKTDISFIGHKGLGFKSILEITETPEIVTKFGTIYFDRELAAKKLNNQSLKAKELPLLFLPMYKSDGIKEYSELLEDEYTTLIILPFKTNVSVERIREDLKQVKISSFPLLGYFDHLFIVDEIDKSKSTSYTVSTPMRDVCEVIENGKNSFRLRLFEHKFQIKEEQLNTLPEDERKLIDAETPLEIKIALSIDDRGRYKAIDNAALYLFYPLEEKSGFRFIIHSFFVVTPNRKGLLENSPLNKFLMDELINYLNSTFLAQIKQEFPGQVHEILAFTFNSQNSLAKYGFYDKLIAEQKELPLIWSNKFKRHLQVSELYIATDTQLKLFTEEKLGGKILHKKEEGHVGNWMDKLLKANELTGPIIKNNIEEYSETQREKNNIDFFQNLYSYAANSRLYLNDKKILLTGGMELMSADSEVYYGGQRTELNIPNELNDTITFLHDDIKFEKFRLIEEYIGAVEFKTDHLVRRILKYIKNKTINRASFLFILRDLKVETSLSKEILEGLLVPIVGIEDWIQPLFSPVYFYSDEIKSLYPDAQFIDLEKLIEIDPDEHAWRLFLSSNNVWSRPAVYLSSSNKITDEQHLKLLDSINQIELKNDFILDKPIDFNLSFQNMIFESYLSYSVFITRTHNAWPFKGTGKQPIDPQKFSTFSFTLQNERWIYPPNFHEQRLKPSEVLVFPASDEQQPQTKVLKKYFPLLFSNDFQTELFRNLGAIQGRSLNTNTAIELFRWAYGRFLNVPQETDFASAWNRLYGFFFDFWRVKGDPEKANLVKQFKNLMLLAETVAGNKKEMEWKIASSILYIDDKPFYDYLPEDVRTALPPAFTKRDKNEIGMVLSKVGIVLSEKIKKTLVQPSIIHDLHLFTELDWAPFALPIIEHELNTHIEESQIKTLNKTRICYVDDLRLEIQVQIENASNFIQPIPYYIQTTTDGEYRILFNRLNQKKQMFSAIHELLEIVLDEEFDIRLELQELSKARNSEEALEILNGLNIDVQRANEIKETIQINSVSERMKFWNYFAQACGIIPEEDEANIHILFTKITSEIKSLDFSNIEEIDSSAHLNDIWTPSTYEAFRRLFSLANITIEKFNSYSDRKIDIESLNRDKLYSLIKDKKKCFVQMVYDGLVLTDPVKQGNFLEIIAQYTHVPEGLLYNSFAFDPVAELNNHVKAIIQKVFETPYELNLDKAGIDELQLYNEQFELLRQSARESNTDITDINTLLEDRSIKSVLCFNWNHVLELFLEQCARLAQKKEETTPEAPDSTEGVNELPINNHKPQFPKAKNKGGGGYGGGFGGGKGKRPKPSQETLDEIGFNGEYYVFHKLSEVYTVDWVSKNGELAGETVCGDDDLGYDMRYINESGNSIFVEVKATSGTTKQFNLTRFEVITGIKNKENYYLFFVINALNKPLTQAENLGTIFKDYETISEFEESEDFLVESNGYQINFN